MRLLLVSALIGFSLLGVLASASAPPVAPAIDFQRDIQPLLGRHCLACHGPAKQKGDLRLDLRADALRNGSIIPGNSAGSPLVQRIEGKGPGKRMPPSGPALTPTQIALVRAWIDQGAHWPAPVATPAPLHWAYRPLVRPTVPALEDDRQLGNPIDAFVQARLESARLSPAPPADRRTLIRRLSFDLLGLPPTPEDIDAFVKDSRPDAYERLVDHLLASPAYGERWARHWLDVVHFAETHGHDQDVPRENAWPYRDYLIRAFNDDRPYGRFIEEQVAGDVLFPGSADGVVATGMLAAGPWDESSQQSIRDDTIDKKQAQNLDRDDMVTTVLSAFNSTTVHCARCHDHKFDPVSQKEYYALQAVFAGVDRANRLYDPDPDVQRRRQELTNRQQWLRSAPPRELLDPANEAVVAAWEEKQRTATWRILVPGSVITAHGSTATKLDDHSVRFGGPRPEREVCTITADSPLSSINAARLEVLTDDSLPHKGPGRQDNGNLHLNEVRIECSQAGSGAWQPVALRSARADFDQAGWTAAMAIDGDPASAWGIHPAIGRSHQIVFVFARALALPSGSRLRFVLEQTHGRHHLIGRLRLAVTASTSAELLAPPPAFIASILAVPRKDRSQEQRLELTRHALLEQIGDELARLPARQMVFAAASDFQPAGSFRPARGCRPVMVLRRGEIDKPVQEARPGALSCMPGLSSRLKLDDTADEGQRRAGLARWLSDERNVLTWRSMANRLWHYHFGHGIVRSPGDLGKMGASPSHPELLDWLACELRDSGGSLKQLHRLLLTSAAYRRSVRHDPVAARSDGDNLLLWRMNRSRLDAESLRDAVLAIAGELNRTMGGQSIRHFKQSPGIHVTPNVDYGNFDLGDPRNNRRSIYRFVFRTLPDPFLNALDCPDASQFTPARSTSLTPLQALALRNDRFMVTAADRVADRLEREASGGLPERIDRLFHLALGRAATASERVLVSDHASRHGLANACRLILNSNEFLFID